MRFECFIVVYLNSFIWPVVWWKNKGDTEFWAKDFLGTWIGRILRMMKPINVCLYSMLYDRMYSFENEGNPEHMYPLWIQCDSIFYWYFIYFSLLLFRTTTEKMGLVFGVRYFLFASDFAFFSRWNNLSCWSNKILHRIWYGARCTFWASQNDLIQIWNISWTNINQNRITSKNNKVQWQSDEFESSKDCAEIKINIINQCLVTTYERWQPRIHF